MSDLKILIEKNEENEVFASSKAAMESQIAQIVLSRFDYWIERPNYFHSEKEFELTTNLWKACQNREFINSKEKESCQKSMSRLDYNGNLTF